MRFLVATAAKTYKKHGVGTKNWWRRSQIKFNPLYFSSLLRTRSIVTGTGVVFWMIFCVSIFGPARRQRQLQRQRVERQRQRDRQ